jgi:tripartite-type tricarboxylate transporter receptor subunit TctC
MLLRVFRILRPATSALLLALVLGSAPVGSTAAEDGGEFFRGKAITYLVGNKPGGGYDLYARLIARHLPRHLPVESVVVMNVPGAGGRRALNRLWEEPPDGLHIATFNTGMTYAQAAGLDNIRFDLRKFSWIGKAGGEPRVFVVSARSGVRDVAALRDREKPLILATSGIGATSHTEAALLAHLLGLDVRLVTGYGGGGKLMALVRGDVDGYVGSYSSLRGLIEASDAHVLFRVAGVGDVGVAAPSTTELMDHPDSARLVPLLEVNADLLRMTVAPPGMHPDRLEVLRVAYLQTLADPALLAEAEKLQIPIAPLGGQELARRVDEALDVDPETAALLARLSARTK